MTHVSSQADMFSAVNAAEITSRPTAPVPANNFHLDGDRGLSASWKQRAIDNIKAIVVANAVEDEGRAATSDEQAAMMRFIGFGASDLANNLFPVGDRKVPQDWLQMAADLRRVTTPAEHSALARATQYAHYTPEFIVRALWAAVRRFGFTGGRVLEPGMGTGLFLAAAPAALRGRIEFTGVERDPITGRLAMLLYPGHEIRLADFTRSDLPADFNLAIGNPPFSDMKVKSPRKGGGLSLHDFFITRSLDLLVPGGLAAFVVSRWTMDKLDTTARETMASMADLLGAIRLPQAAMQADAGTEVVVDLLFFRKRDDGAAPSGHAWAAVENVGTAMFKGTEPFALNVNGYFAAHPEMVLGDHAVTSSQYGPIYTCKASDAPLGEALAAAVARMGDDAPAEAEGHHASPEADGEAVPARRSVRVRVGTAAEGARIKEGSFLVDDSHKEAIKTDLYAQSDRATGAERRALLRQAALVSKQPGKLYQVIDGRADEVLVRGGENKTGIFAINAARIAGLIPVRDAIRDILRAQIADEDWSDAQDALHKAYDAFVAQFGPINKTVITERVVTETVEYKDENSGEVCEREEEVVKETHRFPNLAPFKDDPDFGLVASIEHWDQDTETATKGAIFFRRIICPPPEAEIVTAADALAVVLNERGKVEVNRIAELLGRSVEDTLPELGETIFHNPTTKAWEPADEYLSGMVRVKLAEARKAVEIDRAYDRNVAALERVQPRDLGPSEITAKMGAPWIPADVIRSFISEIMGYDAKVIHNAELGTWTVGDDDIAHKASARTDWGTPRRHAGQLLQDALNSGIPQIYDEWKDADGKKHRTLNAEATQAAKDKLAEIHAGFDKWVWAYGERADRLAAIYNTEWNNLVGRQFDGSHLLLPGASSVVTLRENQKRGIWRVIVAGSTYLAHAVGSGKTMTFAGAIMEQKRLGLISKAMVVVPGHTLAQWAREFLMLYPNAQILVADEENFVKDKRQRFIARAATGNWDAIIITHAAFKKIAAPFDFERSMIEEQIEKFEDMMESVDDDDRVSRKRLEAMKEKLEERLLTLGGEKDNMLTIAEMGVDQLVVDEAQEFRKLTFATAMSGLKGVDPQGSGRAWDLYVKRCFIETKRPGRALCMGSGTCITNTMGEMYTLLRFMDEKALVDRNVQHFDAWASAFGTTRTELELMPSGAYKPVTRFAEFVNIPELTAMFHQVADVVTQDDLATFVKLPRLATGKRQILTFPASPAFKAYQKLLGARIDAIKERGGKPVPGADILLTVIGDGRHAAIDLRMVNPAKDMRHIGDKARAKLNMPSLLGAYEDDPSNKLNGLINNAHRIWQATAGKQYLDPATGDVHPTTGATQMIFSDLGTINAEAKRGFSAYRWMRRRLVALGVPAHEIAFMQDYKKAAAKLRLFNDMNTGRVRILIGSSETMGTGVNAQQRLIAEHHLDVPWLPSHIGQREGRIVRQGNQNEEVHIFAYATLGSMDAPMWQTCERKARFIDAVLKGDPSIRRLEDMDTDSADQFALAKAMASGDARLMRKAGLEAEIARLKRQEAAHYDSQRSVRWRVKEAEDSIEAAERRILRNTTDLAQRKLPGDEDFSIIVEGVEFTDRKEASEALIRAVRTADLQHRVGDWEIAHYGGFPIHAEGSEHLFEMSIGRSMWDQPIRWFEVSTGIGLLNRIHQMLAQIDEDLEYQKCSLAAAKAQLSDFGAKASSGPFQLRGELDHKLSELAEIDADLEKSDAEMIEATANDDQQKVGAVA